MSMLKSLAISTSGRQVVDVITCDVICNNRSYKSDVIGGEVLASNIIIM